MQKTLGKRPNIWHVFRWHLYLNFWIPSTNCIFIRSFHLLPNSDLRESPPPLDRLPPPHHHHHHLPPRPLHHNHHQSRHPPHLCIRRQIPDFSNRSCIRRTIIIFISATLPAKFVCSGWKNIVQNHPVSTRHLTTQTSVTQVSLIYYTLLY